MTDHSMRPRPRLAAATLAVTAALTAAGCWVAPGQGPNRAAFNAAETTITAASVGTLDEAWTTSLVALTSGPIPGPLSQGGGVYVSVGAGRNSNTLVRLNMATGALVWSQPGPGSRQPTLSSLLLIDGGRLVIGLAGPERAPTEGPLAIDPGTGAVSFTDFPELSGIPQAERGSTLALKGDTLCAIGCSPVPAFVGTFITVGSRDGTVTFSGFVDFDTPATSDASLTLGPDLVYLPSNGSLSMSPGDPAAGPGVRAYAVSGPATRNCGRQNLEFLLCPEWATPLSGTALTAAVLSDDGSTLYVGSDAGTLYALDAATGAVRWTGAVGAAIVAAPATAYGRLYVPTADGRLVVLPAAGCGAAACAPVATATTGSSIGVQPALAGGVVFTGSADGSVDAFAADCTGTCPTLWSAETGSAITGAPDVDDGHLLVGTQDGRVIAFSTR